MEWQTALQTEAHVDAEVHAVEVATEVEAGAGVDAEVCREAAIAQAIARWDEACEASVAALWHAVAACGSVDEMLQRWSGYSPLGAQTVSDARMPGWDATAQMRCDVSH